MKLGLDGKEGGHCFVLIYVGWVGFVEWEWEEGGSAYVCGILEEI